MAQPDGRTHPAHEPSVCASETVRDCVPHRYL